MGGGCPKGRRAEDGVIPDRYPLVETLEPDYDPRARRNVEESDGTLILKRGKRDGGTALTVAHARQIGKPCLVAALEAEIEPATFRDWLAAHPITVLNVAGPRESQRPGVYDAACRCLASLFQSP
ncbi:MAG: putative molybdenum carrier protein [Candidatus Contendobacter sp.]|nr:putative molybdenum carrier protein [Candidatus Contendobacter sp.]